VINAIKFSIGEIEASDQYFDHTGLRRALSPTFPAGELAFFIPWRWWPRFRRGAVNNKGNKAIVDQPPLLKPLYEESDSNERLRVSNWIVDRL
jgi:hypothetical protein